MENTIKFFERKIEIAERNNLSDYREYLDFLLQCNDEVALGKIKKEEDILRENATQRGYSPDKCVFSYEIDAGLYRGTVYLSVTLTETETLAKNEIGSYTAYEFNAGVIYIESGRVDRVNFRGWDRDDQLKVDTFAEKIQNRIKIRNLKSKVQELEATLNEKERKIIELEGRESQ